MHTITQRQRNLLNTIIGNIGDDVIGEEFEVYPQHDGVMIARLNASIVLYYHSPGAKVGTWKVRDYDKPKVFYEEGVGLSTFDMLGRIGCLYVTNQGSKPNDWMTCVLLQRAYDLK